MTTFSDNVEKYGLVPASAMPDTWQYENADGELSAPMTYTPVDFYKELIGIDLTGERCDNVTALGSGICHGTIINYDHTLLNWIQFTSTANTLL